VQTRNERECGPLRCNSSTCMDTAATTVGKVVITNRCWVLQVTCTNKDSHTSIHSEGQVALPGSTLTTEHSQHDA
jgi:hypothetical protein